MLETPCQSFPARICCALPDINVNIVFIVIQSSSSMFVSLRKPTCFESGEFNYWVVDHLI